MEAKIALIIACGISPLVKNEIAATIKAMVKMRHMDKFLGENILIV
jgi:hypothetical protein